ncbi:MAG: tetratricopeptide repeat protein [Planctomycetota bacterium]
MNKPFALGSLIALAAVSPVAAQNRELQDEVDFVRKLATEMRFTSLALDQVQSLQAKYEGSDDFKEIYQLGIEISLAGARTENDREKRRNLFKDSLEKSTEFIERYDGETIATQARVTAVRAAYDFGTFLSQEIALAREEAPERLEELESQAKTIYTRALEHAKVVHSALEKGAREEGSNAQRDYYVTWLLQCMIERDLAAVAPEADRAIRADTAFESFDEFIFDVGEETLLGQRGFFEMSKISEVLKDYDDAVAGYVDTVDLIKDTLDDEDIVLPPGLRADMVQLLQEAYGQAAEVRLQSGDPESAIQVVQAFRGDLVDYAGDPDVDPEDQDVFELAHPVFGHQTLLTESRALAEAGSGDQIATALALAQRINEVHGNDFIGRRAKSTIQRILVSQADLVSGELLFEIAKGELPTENGIAGLKRAYAAMTADERRRFGLDLYYQMSIALGQQRRYVESAMAAIVALERHGANDDEAVVGVKRVASILGTATDAAFANARSDSSPAFSRMRERSDALQRQYGGVETAEKSAFRQGRNLFNKGDYAQAAGVFSSISSSDYYDPAQKLLVVAYVQGNDYQKAREAIGKFREFLGTPEAEIPSDRSDLRATREDTIATHDFYEARMNYLESTGTAQGSEEDPTRFEPTRLQLEKVLENHAEKAPAYIRPTKDMVARLYAKSGDLANAEAVYRDLRESYPDSVEVARLATQIFRSHYDRVKQRASELDQLIADEAGETDVERATSQLTEARRAAINSGWEYLQSADDPVWGVSYATLTVAGDLAKVTVDEDESEAAWKRAEDVARKVSETFESTDEHGDEVRQFVLPVLGESLLRQEKFREATSFLLTAVESNPNNYPLKRLLNLAQGGFFKLDQFGSFQRVTGGDEPGAAYDRHWGEYQTWALHPSRTEKFDLGWYQFHLESLMFAILAATDESGNVVDTQFHERAQTLFRIARSFDDFEVLRTQRGPEGAEMAKLFAALARFVR